MSPKLRDILRLKQQRLKCRPPVGWVRFSSLRRLKPISSIYGLDRGLPIDRYYIENFLQKHNADIRGRVLEIGDFEYTRRFGKDKVVCSDVLHVTEGNPYATIVGDLAKGVSVPDKTFDCIILTQTLCCIYDVTAAVINIYKILKSGGVLLATVPGISRISRYAMHRWGYYWRFTSLSTRRLLEEAFLAGNITVETYGNVLSTVAFLHGLAAEELKKEELNYRDPDYEMLITARAVR